MSEANRSIFAERSFVLYYAGQVLSLLGDGLRAFVIPLLVFKLTGSALSTVLTYALEYLPDAVFGLVGGSLNDRLDRRTLMIACDFTRFAIVGLFAVLLWRDALTLPVLYCGIVIVSIATAVFVGGEMTSIPYLLGKARSSKAIAALLSAQQTVNIAAAPLGGILFSFGGALPGLMVNALTYLGSLFSLVLVPSMGPDEPGPPPSLGQMKSDIVEGFRFMHGDVALMIVVYISLALLFFWMMATAILIPFMKIEYGASDFQVGVAYGVIAIGSITGSLLSGAMQRKWPFGPALLIALTVEALIFVPVIFSHRLATAIAFWALREIAGGFVTTQIISYRMRVVPDERMGRVFAAIRFFLIIGNVPGTLLGGWLTDLYSPRLPIIVSTFGYIIVVFAASALPTLRRERR